MGTLNAVYWVQWLVYMPALVAGLPLNLAALWLLAFRVRRHTESTIYLSSLAINDTLLLLSLPFKLHAYNQTWHLGRLSCTVLEILIYVNIYGSILLAACISADRYLVLAFPFHALRLRSPRKAWLVCLAVWVAIAAGCVPVFSLHSGDRSGNSSEHTNSSKHCFQNFSNDTWNKVHLLVAMETVFCVSAVAMVFCSLGVVQVLRNMRRRNPDDVKLRSNKSVKIVLSNLAIFLACFVPYHVAAALYFWAKTAKVEDISQLRGFIHVSIALSSLNCVADGVCYYFILRENLESAQRDRRTAICDKKESKMSIRMHEGQGIH